MASIILALRIIITKAAPISLFLPLLGLTKKSKWAYKLTWAEFATDVPAMKNAAAAMMMVEYCMVVKASIILSLFSLE